MEELTEQVGTSLIPVETTSDSHPNLGLPWTTVHTVRRKAAKRSEEWYQNGAGPLLIPARKKRRIEEPPLPLPASTDEASSNNALAESSEGLPPAAATPPSTDTVDAQLDGDDADANADLLGLSWRDHLSELTDYRKIHGHCYVSKNDNANSKLANWVRTQRCQYTLYVKGKRSFLTLSRIQELESLGFEWKVAGSGAWEDCLSELADYRKIHGHCNVSRNDNANTKLVSWVTNQRKQYKFHVEGKTSYMTTFRIQELEGLGFEWNRLGVTWENRLSELVDYRRIHGHCNVPHRYSENIQLGKWVAKQRQQYRLYVKETKLSTTALRIQELESLGFDWSRLGATWEDRLSQLADYRKSHGHCNVPSRYSENAKLGTWVRTQRQQYTLHLEEKPSNMTTFRIKELESLGFLWARHGAT
jgi:hypothetical protein